MATGPIDKSGDTIQHMFEGVAPRYDFLNHVLSGSLDRVWRRRAVRALGLPAEARPHAPTRVLDLCCGTGDQAASLGRCGFRVAAADFCIPMLALAQAKFGNHPKHAPTALAADALQLPFSAGQFHAVTISFGVRNLADLDRGLAEVTRVLRPGGRLVVLEFALPRWPLLKQLYLFYLRHLLPVIGRLLSASGSAYGYLRDSVLEFPQRDDFLDHLRSAGLVDATWQDLSAGTVCLYSASKAEEPES